MLRLTDAVVRSSKFGNQGYLGDLATAMRQALEHKLLLTLDFRDRTSEEFLHIDIHYLSTIITLNWKYTQETNHILRLWESTIYYPHTSISAATTIPSTETMQVMADAHWQEIQRLHLHFVDQRKPTRHVHLHLSKIDAEEAPLWTIYGSDSEPVPNQSVIIHEGGMVGTLDIGPEPSTVPRVELPSKEEIDATLANS